MKFKSTDIDKELEKCKSMEDLTGKNGLLQRLLGDMVEKELDKEMEEHLGYSKNAQEGKKTGNSENSKTVKSPPAPVEIQDHLEEIYWANVSPTAISNITSKVLEVAMSWQNRPLDRVYLITYFDAIHYKVRENGKIVSKEAYTCLGINSEGRKEVLGLWIGENEGAKFWLKVFTQLKNRGVEDILIACADGLKGLPDAIQTVFPKVEVQLCIIHMIRNTLKFLPHKVAKEFMKDLKLIYRAASEEEAKNHLQKLQDKWEEKYTLAVKPWVNQWENIRSLFKFPEEIRRIIYTTSAVEALHRQFRKVTKNRAAFPSDESLLKLLYLTVENLSEKWRMSVKGWKDAISQFGIIYEDRLDL